MSRCPPLIGSLLLTIGLGVGCNQATQATFDPAPLGLPTVARASDATQGTVKAYLGPFDGTFTVTAANDATVSPAVGTPLLADDRLDLGEDGLAVILFANGNVLRIEGPLALPLNELIGYDDPPVAADFESRLRSALTKADRQRLLKSERIGGWQLRLRAVDGVAAEPELVPEKTKERLTKPVKDGYGGMGRDEKSREDTNPLDPSQDIDGDFSQALPPPKEIQNQGTSKHSTGPGRGDTTGWQQVSAKWVANEESIALPEALHNDMVHCLQPLLQTHVTILLTVVDGNITAFEIEGSQATCLKKLVGRSVPGTHASGKLRVVFELR